MEVVLDRFMDEIYTEINCKSRTGVDTRSKLCETPQKTGKVNEENDTGGVIGEPEKD